MFMKLSYFQATIRILRTVRHSTGVPTCLETESFNSTNSCALRYTDILTVYWFNQNKYFRCQKPNPC